MLFFNISNVIVSFTYNMLIVGSLKFSLKLVIIKVRAMILIF